MKKSLTIFVLIPFLALLVPVHAAALTLTVTVHDASSTIFVPPMTCSDGSLIPGGVLALTSNGVIHITGDANGGLHFTTTLSNSLVLTSLNGVVYTGHYTTWTGGNGHFTSTGATELGLTSSAHATGTDGTSFSFHVIQHITVNPAGTITSSSTSINC